MCLKPIDMFRAGVTSLMALVSYNDTGTPLSVQVFRLSSLR
jgi:hypothetical protein